MTILNNNTNKMSQEFAEWLKTTRKAKRITQLSLAKLANISKAYVGHLENKRPHTTTNALPLPKREVVVAIAKALNADVDEVLTIAGYAPISETESKEFDGVRIALLHPQHYSESQKEQFYKELEFSVALAKKRMEERGEE